VGFVNLMKRVLWRGESRRVNGEIAASPAAPAPRNDGSGRGAAAANGEMAASRACRRAPRNDGGARRAPCAKVECSWCLAVVDLGEERVVPRVCVACGGKGTLRPTPALVAACRREEEFRRRA